MFGFGKSKIQTHPAEVSVGMPAKLTVQRRVERVKRLRASLEKGRGDEKRLAKLQAELDEHMRVLEEHKKALEDL